MRRDLGSSLKGPGSVRGLGLAQADSETQKERERERHTKKERQRERERERERQTETEREGESETNSERDREGERERERERDTTAAWGSSSAKPIESTEHQAVDPGACLVGGLGTTFGFLRSPGRVSSCVA